MHSLYLRIFLLFWVAMACIVAASLAATYSIATRMYGPPADLARRPAVAAALDMQDLVDQAIHHACAGWRRSFKGKV